MASHDYYYRILPENGSTSHYALLDGETQLGALALRNRHGSGATITVAGQTLLAKRSSGLRKHLRLEHVSGGGHFAADALSRGSLELNGVTYRWLPQNARWTEWAWRAADGRELMRIVSHHRYAGHQAEVASPAPLDALGQELALLGWYLTLLNHQDFGMHILTAIDLAFRHGKAEAAAR